MASFEVSEHDVSLLVAELSAQNRDLVAYDGTHLNGPTPVINSIAAMDLTALRKNFLKEYAATKRWQIETGGLEIGGLQVRTDRESQSLINGAYNMAKQDANFTTKFKAQSGFVTLDADNIIAIATAVGAHVAACFAAEANAIDDIESGELTTRELVDAALAV